MQEYLKNLNEAKELVSQIEAMQGRIGESAEIADAVAENCRTVIHMLRRKVDESQLNMSREQLSRLQVDCLRQGGCADYYAELFKFWRESVERIRSGAIPEPQYQLRRLEDIGMESYERGVENLFYAAGVTPDEWRQLQLPGMKQQAIEKVQYLAAGGVLEAQHMLHIAEGILLDEGVRLEDLGVDLEMLRLARVQDCRCRLVELYRYLRESAEWHAEHWPGMVEHWLMSFDAVYYRALELEPTFSLGSIANDGVPVIDQTVLEKAYEKTRRTTAHQFNLRLL